MVGEVYKSKFSCEVCNIKIGYLVEIQNSHTGVFTYICKECLLEALEKINQIAFEENRKRN